MANSSILDRRLYIWHPNNSANAKFMGDQSRWGHAINQLLVYDQVVIPTHDFGIVPALARWYGVKLLIDAIDRGAIRFLRRDSHLAYVGNGNAISTVKLEGRWQGTTPWWQEAISGDPDRSVDLQLEHSAHPIKIEDRAPLRDRILRATTQFAPDNDLFMARVVKETNDGIMASEGLRARLLNLSGNPAGRLDLLRAPGVGPDQVRFSGEDLLPDPVDLILRIAEINLDLLDAERCKVGDICAVDGAELVLESKANRLCRGQIVNDGLVRVLELNGLPDIGHAVAAGQIPFEEVWKLRQHRDAVAFRQWIQKADPAETREMERAYVRSMDNVTSGSLSVRAIRFVLYTVLDSIIGLPVVGAADAAVGDRLLASRRPKLFIDRARRLIPAPSTSA